MTGVSAIAGAEELLGKGVYDGMPKDVPPPVRDRNAVIVGDLAACGTAAKQLAQAGWSVTLVTSGRCGCRIAGKTRRRAGSEVVCATGGEYLEAVVLRRLGTSRIDACNASALFIVTVNKEATGTLRGARSAARDP